MEFLNRIEIQGVTGAVAIAPVGDTRMARFSVVTETAYNGRDTVRYIDSARQIHLEETGLALINYR